MTMTEQLEQLRRWVEERADRDGAVEISWGTLRPQDIIASCLDTLAAAGVEVEELEPGEEQELYQLEELMELMDAASPEGYYFGAHEGDGSSIGWWRSQE